MAAGIYNFTIEQGATFTRIFKYKQADGTPIDLSEASEIRMHIREAIDDTNFITLTLYNGADSFFYKVAAGDTFVLMNNEMDAIDASTTFGAFADITQIKADADTAACDIEIIAVTA